MLRVCSAVLLLTATIAFCQQPEPNVHEIASRVDAHYNHLSSLKESFKQIYNGNSMTRSESGTLWLRRPGKMRWEYTEPEHKLFVSDGKKVWFYVAGEPQAERGEIKNVDDLRSPLRYLLGKTRLEKEFENLSLVQQAPEGNLRLRGEPRALPRVREAQFELNSEYQIVAVTIAEIDGTTTVFQFSDIQENAPAPENLFQFTPPVGVAVVQAQPMQ